ncbi:unnamed protein product [Allacma fusca]|uniref:Sugar transporter n=1 Tax=Allacma fusca TaxID=39272 RepID=A0A8J2NWV3_9HEXA|nr:unnamed protein product [Allacma fusca]
MKLENILCFKRKSNNYNIEERKSYPWMEFFCAFTAAISFFSIGATRSYTSPAILAIQNDTAFNRTLTRNEISWVASVPPFVAFAGAIISAPFLQYVGRQKTLVLQAFPSILGWLFIGFGTNLPMILIGRGLNGLSSGLSTSAAQLYVSECARSRVRGMLGFLPGMMLSLGILAGLFAGSTLHWRVAALILAIVPAIAMMISMALPESPTWLLMKHRDNEAADSLHQIRGTGRDMKIRSEIDEIKDNLKETKESYEKLNWKQVIQRKDVWWPTCLAVSLMIFQQFTGASVVIFYLGNILTEAEKSGGVRVLMTPDEGAVLVGVVQFLAFFISLPLIDWLGRKVSLLTSSAFMIISYISLGFYFYSCAQKNEPFVTFTAPWLPLVSLCGFIASYSMGFASVPFIITSEVFPSHLRSYLCSLCSFVNLLSLCITVKYFLPLKEALYPGYVFFLFALVCGIAIIVIIFALPETKVKQEQTRTRAFTSDRRLADGEKMEGGLQGGYFDQNVSQIIQMNDVQQITFDPKDGHILHVVEDLTDDSYHGDMDQDQVFVIQDDEEQETSEIAVWNHDKGEYEIITSEFNEFTHQILDILDNHQNHSTISETARDPHNENGNIHRKGNVESTPTPITNPEPDVSRSTPIKVERPTVTEKEHVEEQKQRELQEEDQEGNQSENPDEVPEQSIGNEQELNSNSSDSNNMITGDKTASKMIQLETATGRIIQLPGEDENPDLAKHRESMNESASEEEEQETTDLPFACTLCKKRFSRKLHLNNHMERHHGIKYVFTEKGRKVKLVRIPEGFKVIEGEKLDPCVEKLITTIDKDKLHSIIGVEEIEPDETEQNQSGNNTMGSDDDADDNNRLNDLLNGNAKGPFGCGFLFRKINYQAYRVAMDKGETPFAAFYPPDRTNVYLFRVIPAGERQQLFLPATKRDVRNAMGAKKDGGNFIIPLVAALKISDAEEEKKIILEPLPAVKPTKVEILAFEDFVSYARQCQNPESGVKTLADSIEVSPSPNQAPIIVDAAPKLRKKFQRRTTRNCLKESTRISADLCTGNVLDTPVTRAKKTMKNRGLIGETKLQKLRRNLRKEFDDEFDDDDDEEKDASYYPNDSRPKKRGRGRPPGTKNRPKC